MTAEEFVTKVNAIPPDRQELDRLFAQEEPDPNERAVDVDEYFIQKRPRSLTMDERFMGNPIVHLFSRYDLTKFHVGYLQFEDTIDAYDDVLVFGWDEGYALVIDRETQEVDVVDPESGTIAGHAAKDSGRFLDALYLLTEYHKRRVVAYLTGTEDPSGKEYAERIASAAGGVRYGAFYYGRVVVDE